jgi:transcriptional regulator with XRE-family HTH domain
MTLARLQKAVGEELVKLGDQAKEKLSLKAGVSVSTIRNIEAGQVPSRGTAYKVALACDLDVKEALRIAEICASQKGHRTA